MPPDKERSADVAINAGSTGGVTGKGFRKGQSGNPTGRPKIIAEVRDLARAHTEDAIKALVRIVTSGESEAARVSAAQALLDRGWGKPSQSIDIGGQQDNPLKVVQVYLPDNGRDKAQ